MSKEQRFLGFCAEEAEADTTESIQQALGFKVRRVDTSTLPAPMSFWKQNPCSPTWKGFAESWLRNLPPRLIETHPAQMRLSSERTAFRYSPRRATNEDLRLLPEFWTRWYSSQKTRCIVPLTHIQTMHSAGKWEIWIVLKDTGELLGTVIRRWVKGVYMEGVRWEKAGIIDYFCVHPAYRKRGIGRDLLAILHNSTPRPFPPNLMLWEGVQASIPPIAMGMFLSRQCVPGLLKSSRAVTRVPESECKEAWASLVAANKGDIGCWSEYSEGQGQGEVSIWKIGESPRCFVAIWDTFHYSVPDGLHIGIILLHSGKESLDAIAKTNLHGYGVLLVSGHLVLEGWSIDSPFQWIAYNTQIGFMRTKFPGLFL